MANMPGVPDRFTKVTEIQRAPRQVPRTDPPSEAPPPRKSKDAEASGPSVVVQGHGWKFTAPVAILVAILSSVGGLFAGRQSAPATDTTQAIAEMRAETRADIQDIKRTVEGGQVSTSRDLQALSNRLTVLEARLAAQH